MRRFADYPKVRYELELVRERLGESQAYLDGKKGCAAKANYTDEYLDNP